MIAIIKVVAVSSALTAAAPGPAVQAGDIARVGAPSIQLDQVPTERVLPHAPAIRLSYAAVTLPRRASSVVERHSGSRLQEDAVPHSAQAVLAHQLRTASRQLDRR